MYSENIKRAIQKYREENPDLYNAYHRQYYHLKKDDEPWNEAFKTRCREASKKYRLKKLNGAEPKPRGRPRKLSPRSPEEEEKVISSFIIDLNAPFRKEIAESENEIKDII